MVEDKETNAGTALSDLCIGGKRIFSCGKIKTFAYSGFVYGLFQAGLRGVIIGTDLIKHLQLTVQDTRDDRWQGDISCTAREIR